MNSLAAALDGFAIDELGDSLADGEAVAGREVEVFLLAELIHEGGLGIDHLLEVESRCHPIDA